MTIKLSSTLTKISAIAISGVILSSAAIAEAFTVNRTTGFWTDVTGGTQITYGNNNGVSTTFGPSTVQGTTGQNQVRWGEPGNSGEQSGLGFEGVDPMEVDAGEAFQLGTLTHFNNSLSRASSAASRVALEIELDMDELGIQNFDFSFNIEETINSGAAVDCAYPSDTACADRISWDSAIGSQVFTVDGQDYTLELLGFRDVVSSPLVEEFISQEEGTSSVNLFARLIEARTTVPEPTMLLGLGMVGAYLVSRRRRR